MSDCGCDAGDDGGGCDSGDTGGGWDSGDTGGCCDSGDTGGGWDPGDTGGGCDSGYTGGDWDSGETGGDYYSGDVIETSTYYETNESAYVDTTSVDLNYVGDSGSINSGNGATSSYFHTGYNNYSRSRPRYQSQTESNCDNWSKEVVIITVSVFLLMLVFISFLIR